MKITSSKNIIPFDNQEAKILFRDTPSKIDATIDYDIVILVYDVFDNFLFRHKVPAGNYNLNYKNEQEFLDGLKLLIKSKGLSETGKYKVQYNFVEDTFGSIRNDNNSFIITEISADNQELRLNPKINDNAFIDSFNDFKNYVTGFEIEQQISTNIEGNIESYINSFLDSIPSIIQDAYVVSDSGNVVDIDKYLESYYENASAVNNILQNIAFSIESSREAIISEMRFLLFTQNQNIRDLNNEVRTNPTDSNINQLETLISNELKKQLPDVILSVANIELNQD